MSGEGANSGAPVLLLVEDEAMIRLAVGDHLRECGFLVLEACDAEEAVEVFEMGVVVDVLFSDVQMPGAMDGVGLAQWVRTHRPGVAVFLASGNMGKAYTAEALCGAVFFRKPYALETVVSAFLAAVRSQGLRSV